MPEADGKTAEQAGFFRFCDQARAFTTKLKNNPESSNFGVMLEFYWLCAQLGLVAYSQDQNLPKPPPAGTEVTGEFTGETRNHQYLQRSFVMFRYLCDMGYEEFDSDSSDPIENAMDQFLQMTGTHLTNRGLKEMDTYAQKGWDIIEEKGISRANTMSVFLTQYVELLQSYTD